MKGFMKALYSSLIIFGCLLNQSEALAAAASQEVSVEVSAKNASCL